MVIWFPTFKVQTCNENWNYLVPIYKTKCKILRENLSSLTGDLDIFLGLFSTNKIYVIFARFEIYKDFLRAEI